MTTGATGQLGLALPVQGELSGTWGDTVNNGITQYTNIAIAATLTLTNDGAVTLANTTGDASASNIVSTLTGAGTVTAQFAIVRVTGTLTTAKVVTAPSYSKTYTVVNAATGGIVTFKASGQTGVSIAVGESAFVYYNGTDYVKVSSTVDTGVTSFTAGSTGFTPSTATTGAVTLAGTLATTNGGTGLTSFTSGGVVYASSSSALATGSALTFDGTNLGVGLTPTGQSRVHVYTGNNAVNGVQTQFNVSNFPIALASSTSSGFPYLGVNTVQKISSNTQTYAITGFASRLHASGGGFTFSTAASGTAGADITFTDAMTLTAAGNLGIGTTSPSRQLELSTILAGAPTGTGFVGGALRLSNLTEYESNYDTGGGNPDFLGSIEFYSGDTSTGTGVRTAIKTSVDTYFNTNSLCFYTAPSSTAGILERMRISAAGNVGIGTSSPTDTFSFTKALDVNGSSGAFVYVRNNGSATNVGGIGYSGSDLYISNQAAGNIRFLCNTSASERARISSTGGFSVGTTADPGAGAIYATGNITAFFSDKRLKTVSGKIENALDKVAQLSGVYYTFNDTAKSFGYDSDEVQVGVLAQDVEAVLPQIVKAAPFDLDEHGNSKSGENYKTVQYEKLVPLLIEAINELQAKVKALEAK